MKRQNAYRNWTKLSVPHGIGPPRPIVVRAQSIPARHFFPDHTHEWHQMVYAISGVLTVTTDRHYLVVPSAQAVWVSRGTRHRVGSLNGAEFRSLYISAESDTGFLHSGSVIKVSDFLRALIIEAATIPSEHGEYFDRIAALIVDQLKRSQTVSYALPWPRDAGITEMCQALYDNPADPRGPEQWGDILGTSSRTLSRRFEKELGMNIREWRRRLRLIRGIELLGSGLSVTRTALELGYSSTAAFVHMFHSEMGRSPLAYFKDSATRN